MARFLVVDDEPIIAMTIAEWLTDLGHTVLGPAADLASALRLRELPLPRRASAAPETLNLRAIDFRAPPPLVRGAVSNRDRRGARYS
ncbi:MAG TPA: hypothetical protein VN715_09275 [Roseiarcus sp.]|nr:hypothetical protein [Roseiarcus sp.]